MTCDGIFPPTLSSAPDLPKRGWDKLILAAIWRDGGRAFALDQGGEALQDDPGDPTRTATREIAGVFAEPRWRCDATTLASRPRSSSSRPHKQVAPGAATQSLAGDLIAPREAACGSWPSRRQSRPGATSPGPNEAGP